MPRTVRLQRDTRVFKKDGGNALICTGEYIREGTLIPVADDLCIMSYDHGRKFALEFEHRGEKLYLLVGEVDIPEHRTH